MSGMSVDICGYLGMSEDTWGCLGMCGMSVDVSGCLATPEKSVDVWRCPFVLVVYYNLFYK